MLAGNTGGESWRAHFCSRRLVKPTVCWSTMPVLAQGCTRARRPAAPQRDAQPSPRLRRAAGDGPPLSSCCVCTFVIHSGNPRAADTSLTSSMLIFRLASQIPMVRFLAYSESTHIVSLDGAFRLCVARFMANSNARSSPVLLVIFVAVERSCPRVPTWVPTAQVKRPRLAGGFGVTFCCCSEYHFELMFRVRSKSLSWALLSGAFVASADPLRGSRGGHS